MHQGFHHDGMVFQIGIAVEISKIMMMLSGDIDLLKRSVVIAIPEHQIPDNLLDRILIERL